MPIAEDRIGSVLDRSGEVGADAPLGVALGVAESVAQWHGGEIRLRARDGGGGILVELRFPIPDHQA